MLIRNLIATAVLAAAMAPSRPASAHCDTTKGPVVTAALAALDAGDPDLVMYWVRPDDEAAVRAAFDQALKVRALGPDAKALADRYFFETVVRIHRAGEGAPYTGLSDAEPEPIILASDRALASGATDELEQQLIAAVRTGLATRFAAARDARSFRSGDVAAGRKFVAAYVPWTHWVEGVFAAAAGAGEHGEAVSERVSEAVSATTSDAPREGRARLAWIVASLLAVATLVEAALLVQRRRPASA